MDVTALNAALMTLIIFSLFMRVFFVSLFIGGIEWFRHWFHGKVGNSKSLSVEEVVIKEVVEDKVAGFCSGVQGFLVGWFSIGIMLQVVGLIGSIMKIPMALIVYGTLTLIFEMVTLALIISVKRFSLVGLPIVAAAAGPLAIIVAHAIIVTTS